MRFEEIGLAAELRIAGILCLAERMPGIIAATSSRELDRVALAEKAAGFRTVRVALDNVLAVDNDRRMRRQTDRCTLGPIDIGDEE